MKTQTLTPETIPKQQLKKIVDKRVLGELVSIVEKSIDSSDYKEVTSFIREEFKVDVTEDDVIQLYQLKIAEKENELLYTQYGY